MTDDLHRRPAVDLPERSARPLVFDPHDVSRIGLAVLLQRQPWTARCLIAARPEEALTLTERHRPDVAIVDISSAAPFVASHIAPLRAARPAMPILLSSRCRTDPALGAAPGVAGLLTPAHTAEEVIAAVRAALVGDRVPLRAKAVADGALSTREREVLELISTGATNREIAAALHVGTETVKKHAGTLYRKLGVRNRTEAAQRATELLARDGRAA